MTKHSVTTARYFAIGYLVYSSPCVCVVTRRKEKNAQKAVNKDKTVALHYLARCVRGCTRCGETGVDGVLARYWPQLKRDDAHAPN